MKLHAAIGLLGLGWLATATKIQARDYSAQDYYVLQLDSTTSPAQIASSLGLTHEGQLGELEDHHIFSSGKQDHDVVRTALKERKMRKRSVGGRDILDGVKFAEKQKLKPRLAKRGIIPPAPEGVSPAIIERQDDPPDPAAVSKQEAIATALQISDPIFKEQWHLMNTVELGHDVNVTGVWLEGITGQNSTVAMVDDGLDMYSDDLKDNYFAEGSYDFNDNTLEPKPRLSDDRHGTRCAGEIAAVKNNVCGVGVAYNSRISGLRILSKEITDADEAIALNYAYQQNQIYSCSWGPPDDGRTMDAPGILIKRAMLNAVQKGRGGLGSIYVFASGNGAASEDNCNFDGYTNSIYSITVGAIDRKGAHPYYSEKCSANLVVTYSSGSGDAIHTTDVGTNQCYTKHGGTSAAAPLAAGIFALVLQIRPDLTWRDMQYLTVDTAVPVNLEDGEWQTTSIGKKFSHTYGYGKLDSWAIVEAAKTHQKVKPQAWFFSPWIHVNQAIPQGQNGIAVSFLIYEEDLKAANLARVEHVTVTMNVAHGKRGDLSVDLVSPDKVTSHLSATRRFDMSTEGYNDWTFMSVVHWGESGVGTWTVYVKDTVENEFNGTFIDWHLKLWGEAIDADKATLLPMPSEHDDDNHADIISTTTISGTTTSVAPEPTKTEVLAHPSDHPTRPTNSKPTGEVSQPNPNPSPSPSPSGPATPADSEKEKTNSSWLPSFFPTFGVSSKTQIWIYGSAALILVFCIGLGIYLYLARRKRLRNNPRDEWEFDLIQEDEAEGLNSGTRKRGQRTKRRAGELYDAFAAGSDEEFSDDDEDDVENDAEGHGEKRYKDRSGSDDDQHVIGDDEDDDEADEKKALKK
ncbi:peptidase S8/S53 domain-containing protein [Xylogone sp. PMI_703]|nr:peptidase S8/S53 domain-containing protein [Xylogone sp. PMI_703]